MANIIGIIILLLLIAGFAGLIVLQVKLSKKEAVMPGLILPIISFALSVVITVAACLLTFTNMTASGDTEYHYDEVTVSYTDDAEYIEEDISGDYDITEEYEETMTVGIAVLPVLIIHLTPAVVFLIIYFACHPTKKRLAKKAELDKMSISDL